MVPIDCQTQGERIESSPVWDKITSPIAGYVPDWWISTPNVGVYSPGLGVCPGGGNPPPPPGPGPPPPILPPTGGGALDDAMLLAPGSFIPTCCSGRAGE